MTEKRFERYYPLVGKASFENWYSVKGSVMCGCYHCCSTFPSSEMTREDWIPDRHGMTAMCPRCHIDSVLGDAAGIPIQEEALREYREYSFGIEDGEETSRCVVADDCKSLLPHLDAFGVEAILQSGLNEEASGFLPGCYCFKSPDEGNLRMASKLKASGVKVLWYVPGEQTESDSKGAAVSDVILVSGGDPTDTALAGDGTARLFVRTLGTSGILYRLRGGSWDILRPSTGDRIDFDAAAGMIAAGLAYGLSAADMPFETLEGKYIEIILGEAVQYVIEFHQNQNL